MTIKRAFTMILAIILLALVGFVVWAETPLGPMIEAQNVLNSNDLVQYESANWITYQPINPTSTGLIIYPGGRVDYRSYAPMARAIAENGYVVILMRMPLNLAVFSPNAADEVIPEYPEIKHWAIGGHSLGGSMAANYIYTNPGIVSGLVLWASYPADSNNLASFPIKVVSISATQDGLATPEKITNSKPLLPADTTWVKIKGGNHAQFGWYGIQSGDGVASISRVEQQDQIVQSTVELLREIGE